MDCRIVALLAVTGFLISCAFAMRLEVSGFFPVPLAPDQASQD
jgi:hypothetical protein